VLDLPEKNRSKTYTELRRDFHSKGEYNLDVEQTSESPGVPTSTLKEFCHDQFEPGNPGSPERQRDHWTGQGSHLRIRCEVPWGQVPTGISTSPTRSDEIDGRFWTEVCIPS